MAERSKATVSSSVIFECAGSNPAPCKLYASVAQLEARQASTLKAAGSIPVRGGDDTSHGFYGVAVTLWTLNPSPRVRSPVEPLF